MLRRPVGGIRRGGPACATGTTDDHNRRYFSGGETARLRAARIVIGLGQVLAGDAVGVVWCDRHAGNQVAEAVHGMKPAGDRELAVTVEHGPDQVGVLGPHIGEVLAKSLLALMG